MDHRRALAYVFERPGWPTTVLLVTLATLVPLVGPVVALGYQSVLAEHFDRHGDRNWPPFDFARFSDYLQRGLRLLVVTIVVSVVVTPIAMAVLVVGNAIAILLYDPDVALTIAAVGCVVIVEAVLFLAVIYGGLALATPLWVKAALDPDIGAIFDARFVRDFLARTWKPVLASHAFMLLLSTGLMLGGMLLCFVGIFPAMTLLLLVQPHVYAQLNRLYRERGGLEAAPPPPAVGAGPA
jgi:hypothetical protein